MNEKDFYVYMLASKKNGTLYKGMTSNLIQRVGQHKFENGGTFTSKYEVKKLVWYKQCGNWEDAVAHEKRLRRYPRQWKINLIEAMNPEWKDLYEDICGTSPAAPHTPQALPQSSLHGSSVQSMAGSALAAPMDHTDKPCDDDERMEGRDG